ncbi:MAG: AAA family ATPase [Planctomycetaceae bacterium]
MDECAMVTNDKLSRALRQAEKAGCRVVLAGDTKQLPAIGPGGLFRALAARASTEQKRSLTEIVRQREAWAREAIHQVGRGEAKAALTAYGEKGRLHVMPTRDEAVRELVAAWTRAGVENPRDNLILTATNAEVSRLNHEAQLCRSEAGQLGRRSVKVGEERIHEGDRCCLRAPRGGLGW